MPIIYRVCAGLATKDLDKLMPRSKIARKDRVFPVASIFKTARGKRNMRRWKPILMMILSGALLTGCASMHAADVQKAREADKLTVGTVQREIRVGMSGAQVAEVLGSPNIVTTDEKGREVWVYDRISTESVYSSSSALILGILTGGSGGGGGLAGQSAGASSTTQKSLTVIVKFDEQKKVRDFAYRSSSF
jgi:outer membrane protein assembly factor BamE (lipoprotein component of BamABCDE complex)